jgi:predicted nucleic acid-binding Zn ribbon protein
MSDEPVKVCEKCGEPVNRLMFPVAIQFKGKGFYTTDYARRNALGSVGSHGSGGGDSGCSSESGGSSERPSTKDGDGSSGNGKSEPSKATVAAATGSTAKSE